MPAHTHDGIDWVARLADLRRADAANAPAMRAVADRLIDSLPAPHPTVIDVGSGAGGMSAALAEALVGRAARSATGTADMMAAGGPPHDAGSGSATGRVSEAAGGGLSGGSAVGRVPESGGGGLSAGGSSGSSAVGRVSEAPGGGLSVGGLSGGSATGHMSEFGGGGLSVVGSSGRSAVGGMLAGESASAGTSSAGDLAAGVSAVGGSVARVPAGGTLILADMVPELLAAAQEAVGTAVGGSGVVTVRAVQADIADPASFDGLPDADLVWASHVVHHLPDQRAAVMTLANLLAPGGCLALAEGGLAMRCLPWDVGVGEPGLQDRLLAAQGTWFQRMRAEMPGVVRLAVGWNEVLGAAGLSGVSAFSYLVDVPAPLSDAGRAAVVSWLAWMTREAADLLSPTDVIALHRLLDPGDPAYVARRDDVFMLKASTVHLGWR